MIEVGRLCIKTAGRDSGMKCLVVEIIDKNHVLIDGETRRRKCNVAHLLPLGTVAEIKEGATQSEIAKELENLGIKTKDKKPKEKTTRPKKQRKGNKQAAQTEKKETKKAQKKTAKK
jgi:large subunit ribosomal protein L14e